MKILVVSHSSVVGLYQGKLRELAKHPAVTLHLIVPHAWFENNRFLAAETKESLPFQVHIIRAYRIGYIASYFYHPLIFRKTVRDIRPDIVYAEEEPWSVAAWQSLQAARRDGAKFIFFTWENLWRRYKWISKRILKDVLSKASAAVTGNREGEAILQRRGFDRPIVVLPQYGIDVEIFQRNHPEPVYALASLQKPVIGYFGRLEKEKGVSLLLDAVAKLLGEWSLLIVGDGAEKSSLMFHMGTLGLEKRVKFVDAVPHEEIPQYLKHVDILVLPSLSTSTWQEQFGRILVEAMACGVAVIGSDSGAIPEVIGDAGLIFPENDIVGLRKTLDRLIFSPELRSEIAQRGKQRAFALYTNERFAESLYNFFLQVSPAKTRQISPLV